MASENRKRRPVDRTLRSARRLAVERLEDRTPLAADVGAAFDETGFAAGDRPYLVEFRLQIVDENREPITRVEVGDPFQVEVYVDDLRDGMEPAQGGVFSAYVHFTFDMATVSIDGEIEYATAFPNGQTAEIETPGRIENAGAFAGLTPTRTDELLLMSVPFRANSEGVAEFGTEFAESIYYAIGIYGSDELVEPEELVFGAARLGVGQDFVGPAAWSVYGGAACSICTTATLEQRSDIETPLVDPRDRDDASVDVPLQQSEADEESREGSRASSENEISVSDDAGGDGYFDFDYELIEPFFVLRSAVDSDGHGHAASSLTVTRNEDVSVFASQRYPSSVYYRFSADLPWAVMWLSDVPFVRSVANRDAPGPNDDDADLTYTYATVGSSVSSDSNVPRLDSPLLLRQLPAVTSPPTGPLRVTPRAQPSFLGLASTVTPPMPKVGTFEIGAANGPQEADPVPLHIGFAHRDVLPDVSPAGTFTTSLPLMAARPSYQFSQLVQPARESGVLPSGFDVAAGRRRIDSEWDTELSNRITHVGAADDGGESRDSIPLRSRSWLLWHREEPLSSDRRPLDDQAAHDVIFAELAESTAEAAR